MVSESGLRGTREIDGREREEGGKLSSFGTDLFVRGFFPGLLTGYLRLLVVDRGRIRSIMYVRLFTFHISNSHTYSRSVMISPKEKEKSIT